MSNSDEDLSMLNLWNVLWMFIVSLKYNLINSTKISSWFALPSRTCFKCCSTAVTTAQEGRHIRKWTTLPCEKENKQRIQWHLCPWSKGEGAQREASGIPSTELTTAKLKQRTPPSSSSGPGTREALLSAALQAYQDAPASLSGGESSLSPRTLWASW